MYMLVVFFYAYVIEHMGSGPIWEQKVGREARRCRENWWTNLFYVNNYINNEEMVNIHMDIMPLIYIICICFVSIAVITRYHISS